MVAVLALACGGDSFGDLEADRPGQAGNFSLGASLNELPGQLSDFPLPAESTVNCPCEPLPDPRMTLAVLITTPLSSEDVVSFILGELPRAGYEVTSTERSGPQAFVEWVKDGHPGQVNIFPNAGGETSLNINYFTASEP
jgi:hypothetical protein